MKAKKESNTYNCRVCKHRVLLYRMVVCKIRPLIENPRISDKGCCSKYEYKFECPEK